LRGLLQLFLVLALNDCQIKHDIHQLHHLSLCSLQLDHLQQKVKPSHGFNKRFHSFWRWSKIKEEANVFGHYLMILGVGKGL
jgi:hypothetical protein